MLRNFYYKVKRKRQREKDYWGIKLNHKQRNKIALLSTYYVLPRQHSKSSVGLDLFLVTTMRFSCDPHYMWGNERKKKWRNFPWVTKLEKWQGWDSNHAGGLHCLLSEHQTTHSCMHAHTHTPKCIHTCVHTHMHTQATPALSCGFTWFIYSLPHTAHSLELWNMAPIPS